MSGLDAPDEVRVVSAEPSHIRVSVFGGRTQLDAELPLDLPVSSVIPDLARLIRSRESHPDEDPKVKEQRRTFWVLARFNNGAEIPPDATLREAGITNGELLRLSSTRALSPPALFDDVVDAAAQLNKASYAEWDGLSARWMAFLGAILGSFAFAALLIQPLSTTHRAIMTGLGVVVIMGLATFAAIAHRNFALDDVATALGAATIPISAVSLGVPLAHFGSYGLAGACLIFILINYNCYRAIGTGHWAFLASSLVAGVGGVAILAYAIGARIDLVCVFTAVIATLVCTTVPRLTARLDHFETPVTIVGLDSDGEWSLDNPVPAAETSVPTVGIDSGATMPTAEQVWARVHAAMLTRSALLLGLAGTATAAGTVLLRNATASDWPQFVFVLVVAVVLGLRSRQSQPWAERIALAFPATVLAVIACALVQGSENPLPLVAVGLLLAVSVGAVVLGLTARPTTDSTIRRTRMLDYLDYLAIGALIPVGLWAVGAYEFLGPWW